MIAIIADTETHIDKCKSVEKLNSSKNGVQTYAWYVWLPHAILRYKIL